MLRGGLLSWLPLQLETSNPRAVSSEEPRRRPGATSQSTVGCRRSESTTAMHFEGVSPSCSPFNFTLRRSAGKCSQLRCRIGMTYLLGNGYRIWSRQREGSRPFFHRENPPQIQSGSLPTPERRSVQILHPFAGPIQQYVEEIADADRYRPDHCPQYEAARPMTAHGFYSRTLVDLDFDGSIRVRGYLCHACTASANWTPCLPTFSFALRGSDSTSTCTIVHWISER
jgi:hypothetical protein